jgi:hypothetical protein
LQYFRSIAICQRRNSWRISEAMAASSALAPRHLAEWFAEFCGKLQVQDGGTISYRYKEITKRLNTDYWETTSDTSLSLYAGSYGRGTAIDGFSDLDVIFQLP